MVLLNIFIYYFFFFGLMKEGLTSLEIHYLIKELQFLLNSRVDNIYHPRKDELVLQLHSSGSGKSILRFISGKFFYLSSFKEEYKEPSQFCFFLRKYLSNAFLRSISQIRSERIVELRFEKKEIYKLIFEFFGKGNVVFCSNNNKIMSALVYKRWKDREIRPNVEYVFPKKRFNIFELSVNDLGNLFESSNNDLVRCLATELGLGGSYSEELCLISNIDKGKRANTLKEGEVRLVFDLIKEFIDKKVSPVVVYDNDSVKDIVPFELKIYDRYKKKRFDSYNKAFDYYFISEYKKKRMETGLERDIARLNRVIKRQEDALEELRVKEEESRKKANMIYEKYQLISEIISHVRKLAEKYSWEKIKEILAGHKVIKKINPKNKTIEIEI